MKLEEILERLKRKLLSGHTELNHASSVFELLLEELSETGVSEMAMSIHARRALSVSFETDAKFRLNTKELCAMLGSLTAMQSRHVTFSTENEEYFGYSGNGLDWVLLGFNDTCYDEFEKIVEWVWYQLFEA